jgi:hypothetical protein
MPHRLYEAALGVTWLLRCRSCLLPAWRPAAARRSAAATAIIVPGAATRPTPVSITSVNGATGSITPVTGIITALKQRGLNVESRTRCILHHLETDLAMDVHLTPEICPLHVPCPVNDCWVAIVSVRRR